jgi:hypothetical protein
MIGVSGVRLNSIEVVGNAGIDLVDHGQRPMVE